MASNWRTNRPTKSLIGIAFSDEDQLVERFLEVIDEHLTRGDDWSVRGDETLTWFWGPLATDLRVDGSGTNRTISADMTILEGIESAHIDALAHLNVLNTHAAGWFYWFDEAAGRVVSTVRSPLQQANWWWAWNLLEALPMQATAAFAAADSLLELFGGEFAIRDHPQQGRRPHLDGWLQGTRLGIIEPTPILGTFTTTLEAKSMEEFLDDWTSGYDVTVTPMCEAVIRLGDGRSVYDVGACWNPQVGWGRRHTTYAIDFNDDGEKSEQKRAEVLIDAARRNAALASDAALSPIFGGWVTVDDRFLVHNTWVHAIAIEHIAEDSQRTFGVVLGLMAYQVFEALNRQLDYEKIPSWSRDVHAEIREKMGTLYYDVGPRGYSYFADIEGQPSVELLEVGKDAPNLLPTTSLCNFGKLDLRFTAVCSLEYFSDGERRDLFWCVRTPTSRFKRLIGTAEEFGDLLPVVETFMAQYFDDNGSPLLDWFHAEVSEVVDPAFEGLVRLSEWAATAFDLEAITDDLLRNADDPWMRAELVAGHSSSESAQIWADSLFTRELHASAQLYMRTFWDAFQRIEQGEEPIGGDPLDVTTYVYSIRDRLMADDDFRGTTGEYLVHPYSWAERD